MRKATWKYAIRAVREHGWLFGEIFLVLGGTIFIPFMFATIGLTMTYWSGQFGRGLAPLVRTEIFYRFFWMAGLIMLVSATVSAFGAILMRRSTHYDTVES